MHVRRAASLTLPALAIAALAASVLTSPAHADPLTPGPRADIVAPEAGSCWDYTYKQAGRKSYTGAPVDCAEQHTIETVITLDVPKDVAAKGNNSRDLILWVDARCQVEVNRYAGVAKPEAAAPGTRTWYFWYTPSVRQWKSGAHWVSCAAASVPSDERKLGALVPVTGSIADTPDLTKPITFKTDYGLGRYAARKPMTAIAGRPYPGNKLQNRAATFCEKALGHNKFFWYGPSETDWVNGLTAVRCYSLKKS